MMNELKQKTITALNKQVGLLIEGGVSFQDAELAVKAIEALTELLNALHEG